MGLYPARKKLVGTAGVAPASHPCHGCILLLKYAPKIGRATRTRTGMFLYPKQAGYQLPYSPEKNGRGGEIRTRDFQHPKLAGWPLPYAPKVFYWILRYSIFIHADDDSQRRSTSPDQVIPGGIVTEVPRMELPTRTTRIWSVVFVIETRTLFSGDVAHPPSASAARMNASLIIR